MDPFVTGSLIMAGGNLLGGFLGERGADRRNEAEIALMREQMAAQKEFAQHGIRWKVDDARAAGIHPLFAIGAPPLNYSPVSVGLEQPNFGMAEAFARTGQDIGRAIHATRSGEERIQAAVTALQIENMGLQNDLLRSQIAKFNSAQVGPGLPGYSGVPHGVGVPTPAPVTVKPLELNMSDPGNPAKEAGYVADYGFARTPTGLAVVPSEDVKNRIEDQLVPEIGWAIRNNILPNFGMGQKPDPYLFDSFDGRPVYDWKWNHWRQEWSPVFYDDTVRRIEGR